MKKRLTIENRILIENLLKLNYKLKDIARAIGVYPSTISREIKSKRKGNDKIEICDKTNRYPFVCYNCSKKVNCKKKKYYYNYVKAQEHYNYILKYSRTDIDMSLDELYYWDEYFKEHLKTKNQPITHIFKNIENTFPKSMPTFYRYIHNGHFPSLNDKMLARAYSYKPRKRSGEEPKIRIDNSIRKGRTLENMKAYLQLHSNANIVEMDTVIGEQEDKKCIMTLYFRNSKLMLMFLIDKYKPKAVSDVFKNLRKQLGYDLFKNIYGEDCTKKLHLTHIKHDEVNLSYKLLTK